MLTNGKARPKYEEIVEKIRERIIVTGELKPGDRLPDERTMARNFGVSRTAIRDAVRILDANGLVIVKKALGIFVADNPGIPSDILGMKYANDRKKMMEDWYAVRLALEPEMLRMVVSCATDEEIRGIAELSRQEAEAAREGRVDFLEIDLHFHSSLAKATHNEVMEYLIRSLQQSVYYGIVIEEIPINIIKDALKLHDDIVKFLIERDAEGAVLAMRYHLLWVIKNADYFM